MSSSKRFCLLREASYIKSILKIRTYHVFGEQVEEGVGDGTDRALEGDALHQLQVVVKLTITFGDI